MATIKITCDSACDLPGELLSHYRISVFPMDISLGGEHRRDLMDVTSQELYEYSFKTGTLPDISSVSIDQYRSEFQKYTQKGMQVLHVSLSGKISACFQNAMQAAKEFSNVSVIDSESISVGVGQLALLAAELANADYRLNELTDAINEMKQHMDVSCILQTSYLLHRKGKTGGLSAFGEHFLNLKPEIDLQNGQLRHGKHFRGNMEDSILSYVRSHLANRKNIQTDRIFVTYSGVPREIVNKVRELLSQLQPFEQILEFPVASAVSCRCGPGSLGLAFMTK